MKWLKRKLYSWMQDARDEEVYGKQPIPAGVLTSKASLRGNDNKLNFSVYKAKGGHVVEFNHYDSVKDRHFEALHIITDQEDFAKELGNIVFMECLQR